MGGKRAARAEEFIGKPSWAASALSSDLVESANRTLEQALHDRRGNVYRLATTHYTPCAIGAVALVVTAFEAFLNQAYVFSLYDLPWACEFVAHAGLLAKYEGLFHTVSPPGAVADTRDLGTLIDVRHEIMHYLPRPTPKLIEDLEARGLMSTPAAPGWDMGQKLPSYALAYWAFETVEAALQHLDAFMPKERWLTMSMAGNFSLYRDSTCPPAELSAFDAAYNLELTEEGGS